VALRGVVGYRRFSCAFANAPGAGPGVGFRVSGVKGVSRLRVSGLKVLGSDFGFEGPVFKVRFSGFGFRVSAFRFRISGFGFRVSGFGLRISGLKDLGLGCRVSSFGFWVWGF